MRKIAKTFFATFLVYNNKDELNGKKRERVRAQKCRRIENHSKKEHKFS